MERERERGEEKRDRGGGEKERVREMGSGESWYAGRE